MAGYSKLSRFMTEKHHPILRKYQSVAMRDLLYLQAELCHLEHCYEKQAQMDASETTERNRYNRDWFSLSTSARRDFGGKQWELAIQLREKLREYYTAVQQYKQIASLPEPKESERAILLEWIHSSLMGGGCRFLGRDLGNFKHLQPSVYESKYQKDLTILSDNHGEDDIFTKFLTGPVLSVFHWFWSYRKTPLPIDPENPPVGENQSSLHFYDNRRVEMITNLFGTVFSSLAPLVSIVVLSFVKQPSAKIGLVCAFTLLFCLCLAIATKARRVEIFAATAAFASVQVVFVGSSNSGVQSVDT